MKTAVATLAVCCLLAARLYVEVEYTDPATGLRCLTVSNELVFHKLGDVTGDDAVSLVDALLVFRWVMSGSYPELQRDLADCNRNGRADIGDAVLCLRWALGSAPGG